MSDEKKVISLHLGTYEIFSFIIFALASLVSIAVQPSYYQVYVALVIIDLFGTLFDVSSIISIDRSFFAFFFVALGIFGESYSSVEAVLSIIGAIIIVDFTLLLRKIQDTHLVGPSVLVRRARAYVSSFGTALLVSYLFLFLFSQISFTLSFAILIFGVSTILGLMIFILVMKSVKSTASNVDSFSADRS